MVFNDTTTKLGLLQDCEMKLFGDNGYGQITGNADRLLQFTARINRRQDRFIQLAMAADGRWQYDDTNFTDYTTATTTIVSGQRDYVFDVAMMEIEKVVILPNSSVWTELTPFDINDPRARAYIENNTFNTGIPTQYDKSANSVFLDPVPNFTLLSALKVIFKRGASYFLSTDTTKAPGFAGIFHNYLSTGASLDYAIDRNLTTQIQTLTPVVQLMEDSITDFFSKRSRDEQKVLRPAYKNSR